MWQYNYTDELYHYGVLGMKWGIRRAKKRGEEYNYRDARASLEKLNTPGYVPTSKDLKRSYRIFNYVIPFSDVGDEKLTTDVVRQRTKFFNELKKRGYGAVLDTNDAIYGGYKADSPVIVFDMSGVALKYARRTSIKDKEFATAATVGRKVIMNAI